MHRIRSQALVHRLHDQPSTNPAVRTPAVEYPTRQVNRVPSLPQDRKQKQAIRPTHTQTSRNASDFVTVSPSSSNPSSNTNKLDGKAASAADDKPPKPGWGQRMKAGSIRFVGHTKDAVFHSWINVLLVFVPVGIAVNYVSMPQPTHATVVFSLNAVAIIPLAGLLAHATESVASRMGDTWGALLNVSFGNAVELIIFIIALAKNEIAIVQASILGSILANLLLILGMAFLFGGLRYQEQIYNSTVTQMSACLLSLAVISLLLPTAFHASFADASNADYQTLKTSRGTSVVLLLIYILYLLFQLKSHAYMYESTPQNIIDEETLPGVLAEYLDSSSSNSDTSSSSSSDSDSSAGSHTTTRKRIQKAISKRMRRKSNASSVQTASASVPSTIGSPPGDKRSLSSVPGTPEGGYFDLAAGRVRRESHAPSFSLPPVFSGDEADYDGENELDPNAPRIRDFEAERRPRNNSEAQRKMKKYKHKIKKYKQQKKDKSKDHHSLEQVDEATTPAPQEPQVSFIEPSNLDGTSVDTAQQQATGRRQLTNPLAAFPRPALPSVLTNTVFSQPRTQYPGTNQPAPTPFARQPTGGLRRTSSLPNMVRQPVPGQQPQPAHRGGTLVMNEADAIRKDEEEEGEPHQMSRTAAVVLLLVSTGLVAFCAELMVDAIPLMISGTTVSQAFIGLIILPIVGNAAEHVTAVTVAAKNKMDLAIGVAVGSSIQIALFVTPFVVLLGWIMEKDMSLYFNLFETVSLFVTVFVVNFLVLDGRSNYLEGSLLIAAYVIIAVCSFFYPAVDQESAVGGGNSGYGAAG